MLEIAIPRMVEEPHLDPGIGEPPRDEHVILAERVELELLREADLVRRGAGRVVAARRDAGVEIAVRLEVHRASVLDQALLAKPGLGHDAPALGPGGDEVELVPGPGEALDDRRAVLVRLELAEELPVVERDPEAVLLLAAHVLDLRQGLPSEVLVRQLEPVALGERARVGHRARGDDVVEIDTDPHAASPSSTRVSASRQSPRASTIDARTCRWPCCAFG